MSVRKTVYSMLDAAAAGDFPRAERIARMLRGMCPCSQRESATRHWIKAKGAEHPEMVEWLRAEAERREEERRAIGEPELARRETNYLTEIVMGSLWR